jgi:hypothetical protein
MRMDHPLMVSRVKKTLVVLNIQNDGLIDQVSNEICEKLLFQKKKVYFDI